DSTGSVNGTFAVGGNLSGTVQVDGTLSQLTVGGSTPGSISAGNIGTITASGGVAGSPVFKIKQGGVLRQLFATQVGTNGEVTNTPTPSSVVFDYFYDSTGTGNPQLSVKVTNTGGVKFDLSLSMKTAAGFDLAQPGFDLARLFANGSSGVRDVVIE